MLHGRCSKVCTFYQGRGWGIKDSSVTIDRIETHTVWGPVQKWVCFVPRKVRKIKIHTHTSKS